MGAETDFIIRTAPLIMLVALLTGTVGAFSISPTTHHAHVRSTESRSNNSHNNKRMGNIHALNMASSDDNEEASQEDKLAALGYSSAEISRSKSKGDDRAPQQEVFVEEFEVDAATLTAVGFGLSKYDVRD